MMGNSTFYKWREKYGGVDASLMTRMKELEDENRRLKKMYVDQIRGHFRGYSKK
ncbi:transposase [Pseudoalteromonas sp. TB64]|uniref:transposase n=1 Tax=Pseudoalteromonas sp. TB64 TaxID=1938600 RepID=UPI0004236DC4|nr:transposase [Pseudoalteromonas sp. TB64]